MGLAAGVVCALLALAAVYAQAPGIVREGGNFRRDFSGTYATPAKLRIAAHGPVNLRAGAGDALTYTVSVSVRARSEAEARSVLEHYKVRLEKSGDWLVLTAPGGPVISTVTVKTPRLESAAISTSDGKVEAVGIAGPLEANTGGGEVAVDRIQGDCRLVTGGGDVRAGTIGGALYCRSGAGRIQVASVRGQAVLETLGGDIAAGDVGGSVRAETGGGGIHVVKAGGAVTANTGGGEIVVDRAGGIVTARNMAGPVLVGAAGGVQCESASGGIRVGSISGPMRVSTSLGNIMANLMGPRLADSYLATGNGDITVWIPSNVGVTIRARNDMADSLRRITTDFSGVNVRRVGRQVVAEGPVNGGGPLLQISATVGNIIIRKQR
ncbi:MAG: hypothetical protein JST11_17855 [Acidobacteria bacterium]|nr:hypothetical protein [Acidobacteriota bacterium]